MKFYHLLAAAAALLSAVSCAPAPTSAPKAEAEPAERPLSAAAVSFNDSARFIAGLKGRPGGPFAAHEQTPDWQAYAKGFEETWAQFQTTQAEPMRTFQKRTMAPLDPKGSFVFYPFSGPDVLYLTGFYPGRPTYVMVGLEPAGTLRSPADFKLEETGTEMKDWTRGVRSIFKRSFFVTSEMDKDFRGRVADGLLETICLLLARAGYTIEGIRHGNLSDEGAFTDFDAATAGLDAKGRPKKPMGVEVSFRLGATGETQKVYYFSKKLDTEFKSKPDLSNFLLKLGQPDTLIKSAQFIMHWPGMKDLRNQVLETSRTILQDDTGVPFRFLKAPDWNVKVFGQYSMPDKPFKTWYQKDLAAAFEDKATVGELGLELGYGAGRRPTSMIMARRAVLSAAATK